MKDQNTSRLSEFTWYSRLATWIGAAMLLVQSVLGRSAGPVTVLAVLLLGIGFLCFLIGLAVDNRVPATKLLIGPGFSATESPPTTSTSRAPLRPETPICQAEPQAAGGTVTPVADSVGRKKRDLKRSAPAAAPPAKVQGPGRRPKFRERAKKIDSRPEPRAETAPELTPPQTVPIQPVSPHVGTVSVGVATELLGPGSVGVGAECPRCGHALRLGQLAASCPVCGRTHHAVCWMENHFHCGAPDCPGYGSLDAPAASPQED